MKTKDFLDKIKETVETDTEGSAIVLHTHENGAKLKCFVSDFLHIFGEDVTYEEMKQKEPTWLPVIEAWHKKGVI